MTPSAIRILALDASSTHVGVCYDGRALPTWTLPAKANIAARCQQARDLLAHQLQAHPDVDLVVIESPVARFAKAVIPQARVSGALLALLNERGLAWLELPPQDGKTALTGKGNADKDAMMAAARERTGEALDEHQADAYGLWCAACTRRVQVTR